MGSPAGPKGPGDELGPTAPAEPSHRQAWLGGPRRLTVYLATLDCATSNPSLSNSPWMRGAPQCGFSTLICRINPRNSVAISGRPPCGRDFQRQLAGS